MSSEKPAFEGASSPHKRLIIGLSGMALGFGAGMGLVIWSGPDSAIAIDAAEQGQPADEIFLLDKAVLTEFFGGIGLAGAASLKGGSVVGAAWKELHPQTQDTPEEVPGTSDVLEGPVEQPCDVGQELPPANEP